MTHNIEWINNTAVTVDYSLQAVHEYDQGLGDGILKYTALFEREFNASKGQDIGGLIVYSESIVYDYENFVGWVK